MSPCRQCGAILPENSRYCLQCGTETRRSEGGTGQEKELDFLKPALGGGVVLGVLSGLPYIQFACCLWAQLGGALGAWMLQKQGAQELKYGDGAFVGVIAGLIGAFVATLVSIPVELITLTPEAVARFQERLEGFPMSPAVREAMFQFMSPGFNLSRTLIGLLMGMLGYGLFAMIGGILTVALLNRNKFD